MRQRRLNFVSMLVAVTSAVLVVLLGIAQYQTRTGDVQFPELPDAPRVRDTTRPSGTPPPPPPPHPTWEQFVAKVNTFRK